MCKLCKLIFQLCFPMALFSVINSIAAYIYICIILFVVYFTASGILKGYDPLLNLVLDNTTEFLRGMYSFLILHIKIFFFIFI